MTSLYEGHGITHHWQHHCSLKLDQADKKITGGRLNKKDGLTRYGNSHVKDKTS